MTTDIKQALRELLLDQAFQAELVDSFRDPRVISLLQGRWSSVEYFRQRPEWDGLQIFQHDSELQRWALTHKTMPETGIGLEFGVAGGHSIRRAAEFLPKGWKLFGFDSFEGLPEPWHAHPAGQYTQQGKLPDVPENVTLVKGWFDETLPGFVEEHLTELTAHGIDYLHLDADLYSSTVTALEHVGRFLNPGCIVLFDEYHGYGNWEAHEHKAWLEFVARSGCTYRFTGMTSYVQASSVLLSNPLRENDAYVSSLLSQPCRCRLCVTRPPAASSAHQRL